MSRVTCPAANIKVAPNDTLHDMATCPSKNFDEKVEKVSEVENED